MKLEVEAFRPKAAAPLARAVAPDCWDAKTAEG